MPVFGPEQQALVRRVEDKMLLFRAAAADDQATPFQTNDRLFHALLVVALFELIGSIHVKNALDFKRNNPLDDGEAAAGVRNGFQVD